MWLNHKESLPQLKFIKRVGLDLFFGDMADSTKRGEEGRAKLNAFYSRLLIHLWLWFMFLSFLTMWINYHIKIIRFWLVYVFFFNFFCVPIVRKCVTQNVPYLLSQGSGDCCDLKKNPNMMPGGFFVFLKVCALSTIILNRSSPFFFVLGKWENPYDVSVLCVALKHWRSEPLFSSISGLYRV